MILRMGTGSMVWVIAMVALLLAVRPAAAVDGCKVKIDKKTGAVLIDIKGIQNDVALRWGPASGAAANTFSNTIECVDGTSGKRCRIGEEGAPSASILPPTCTVYIDDGVAEASCVPKNCIPTYPAPFGTGSEGDVTISASEDWTVEIEAPTSFNFDDLTIEAGQTLTVDSGTVIRCRGAFVNDGTIVVTPGARGSTRASLDDTNVADMAKMQPAHPGVSRRSAGDGEYGNDARGRDGGNGGSPLTWAQGRNLRTPLYGGGGGGVSNGTAGDGGGALTVLAFEAVTNTGSIVADGATGANATGGGGGGVVILASAGIVTNSGSVSADGANGGPSDTRGAAGGGGGGGVVHFFAPTVDNSGTTTVDGGSGGSGQNGGLNTGNVRSGGGGGGGCGGPGGEGGLAGANDDANGGVAGTAGLIYTTLADPSFEF